MRGIRKGPEAGDEAYRTLSLNGAAVLSGTEISLDAVGILVKGGQVIVNAPVE